MNQISKNQLNLRKIIEISKNQWILKESTKFWKIFKISKKQQNFKNLRNFKKVNEISKNRSLFFLKWGEGGEQGIFMKRTKKLSKFRKTLKNHKDHPKKFPSTFSQPALQILNQLEKTSRSQNKWKKQLKLKMKMKHSECFLNMRKSDKKSRWKGIWKVKPWNSHLTIKIWN